MGRPPALTAAQQKEATKRRAQGATLDELARSYNVGISTIRRAFAARPGGPHKRSEQRTAAGRATRPTTHKISSTLVSVSPAP
jgi:hypothetical protein